MLSSREPTNDLFVAQNDPPRADFVQTMTDSEKSIMKAYGDFLRDAGRRRFFFTLLLMPPRRAAAVDAPAAGAGMRRPSTKTSSSRRTLACQPGWSCR